MIDYDDDEDDDDDDDETFNFRIEWFRKYLLDWQVLDLDFDNINKKTESVTLI